MIDYIYKASDLILHTEKVMISRFLGFNAFPRNVDPPVHDRILQCYEELLVKFPCSVALQTEFAIFCDNITCNFDKATKNYHSADVLKPGVPCKAGSLDSYFQPIDLRYVIHQIIYYTTPWTTSTKWYFGTHTLAGDTDAVEERKTEVFSIGSSLPNYAKSQRQYMDSWY